jgi:hypothetical protein
MWISWLVHIFNACLKRLEFLRRNLFYTLSVCLPLFDADLLLAMQTDNLEILFRFPAPLNGINVQ